MRKHGFALDYGIHAEFVQAACRGILTPHPNPLPEGEGIFEIVLKNPIIQSNPVISCHSDRGWSGVLAGIGWVLGPGCSWMAGSGWEMAGVRIMVNCHFSSERRGGGKVWGELHGRMASSWDLGFRNHLKTGAGCPNRLSILPIRLHPNPLPEGGGTFEIVS